MLNGGMKESTESRMSIQDLDPRTVESMLLYIYTGKVDNLKENVDQLLIAADMYNLAHLKDVCEAVLIATEISATNAMDLLVLADLCKVNKLKNHVVKFVAKNPKMLEKDENIKKLETNKELLLKVYTAVGKENPRLVADLLAKGRLVFK